MSAIHRVAADKESSEVAQDLREWIKANAGA